MRFLKSIVSELSQLDDNPVITSRIIKPTFINDDDNRKIDNVHYMYIVHNYTHVLYIVDRINFQLLICMEKTLSYNILKNLKIHNKYLVILYTKLDYMHIHNSGYKVTVNELQFLDSK